MFEDGFCKFDSNILPSLPSLSLHAIALLKRHESVDM